jgi:hypothetical protein
MDPNHTVRIIDFYNQPIMVAFNIEHYAVISQDLQRTTGLCTGRGKSIPSAHNQSTIYG